MSKELSRRGPERPVNRSRPAGRSRPTTAAARVSHGCWRHSLCASSAYDDVTAPEAAAGGRPSTQIVTQLRHGNTVSPPTHHSVRRSRPPGRISALQAGGRRTRHDLCPAVSAAPPVIQHVGDVNLGARYQGRLRTPGRPTHGRRTAPSLGGAKVTLAFRRGRGTKLFACFRRAPRRETRTVSDAPEHLGHDRAITGGRDNAARSAEDSTVFGASASAMRDVDLRSRRRTDHMLSLLSLVSIV